MASEHRGPKLYTPVTAFSAFEHIAAPEINLASDDDAHDSLYLIDPNLGGILFYDDIWMVDILGVDQDIDLI